MSKITVIGSMVMDNVAKMAKFPQAGETVLGATLEFFPGGKGANQCVSVARLGGDVEMVGMLGKDGNGEVFRNIFKEEGIKSDNVFSCDKPTAVAQIQINEEGQNRICVIPCANFEFGIKELDKVDELIKQTELVILQLELRLDITKEIIRRVHGYGKTILLNPAPAVKLEKEILGMVDYITPNETELSILTDMPTDTDEEVIAAAKELLSYGTKTVVATIGSRGALIATKEHVEIVGGYKVQAIDTVAAGDSFNGALAVALTEGKSLKEAVQFANAMGALTVTKKGAIPSLHTRAQVEEFIAKNAK
jgi:ribokinase